jgi:hypothetical protein
MLIHALQVAVRDTLNNLAHNLRKEFLENFVLLPLLINYFLIPLTLSGIALVIYRLQLLDYDILKKLMILTETPIRMAMIIVVLLLHILTAYIIIGDMLEASSRDLKKEGTTTNEKLGTVELLVMSFLVTKLRRLIPVSARVGGQQKRKLLLLLMFYLLLFSLPWDIIVAPEEMRGEKKLKDATLFAVIFASTSKDLSFEDVKNVLISGSKSPENLSFMTKLICEICENVVRKSYSDKNANSILKRNPCAKCAHICIESDEGKKNVIVDYMNYFGIEKLYIDLLQRALNQAKSMLLGIPTYTCPLQSMLKLLDKDFEKAEETIVEFFKDYAVTIGDVMPLPDNVLIDNFIRLIRDDNMLNKLENMTRYFIAVRPFIIIELDAINVKQITVLKSRQQITRNEYCKVEVCIPMVIALGITTSQTQSTMMLNKICKE